MAGRTGLAPARISAVTGRHRDYFGLRPEKWWEALVTLQPPLPVILKALVLQTSHRIASRYPGPNHCGSGPVTSAVARRGLPPLFLDWVKLNGQGSASEMPGFPSGSIPMIEDNRHPFGPLEPAASSVSTTAASKMARSPGAAPGKAGFGDRPALLVPSVFDTPFYADGQSHVYRLA